MEKRQKLDIRKQTKKSGKTRQFLKIGLIVVLFVAGLGVLAFLVSKNPADKTEDIISRNGLHWHPELSIYIKGQKQEIPADIGLGFREEPIHTHDAMGVIHLEFSGLVVREDAKLANFFQIWGKQFNSNCIFKFCNGSEGKIKFSVNGKENNEFENYIMRDGDKIEIKYE